MSSSQNTHSSLMVWAAAIVAVVGARAVLQAVEDFGHKRERTPSSLGTDDCHCDRSPAALVTFRERQLAETRRQIANTREGIAKAQESLARAWLIQQNAPSQIALLTAQLRRLEADTTSATKELQDARTERSAFEASIAGRMTRAQSGARDSSDRFFATEKRRIRLEREQRNELRKRIGARPEDAAEVYETIRQERIAKRSAAVRFSALVDRERSKIRDEQAKLASALASAEQRLRRLTEESSRTSVKLSEERRSLEHAVGVAAAGPTRILGLQERLDDLERLRSRREDSLEAAIKCKRKHDQELAETKAREEQLANTQAREVSRQRAAYAEAITDRLNPSSPPRTPPKRSNRVSSGIPTQTTASYGTSRYQGVHYYDPTYRPAVGSHYVSSYFRRDGTYVSGHMRTNADGSFWNNWSSSGNFNPYTGRVGTRLPPGRSYSRGSTSVRGYFRKNGRYVRGHYRRR